MCGEPSASQRHASVKESPRRSMTRSMLPMALSMQAKHRQRFLRRSKERLALWSSWKGHRHLCPWVSLSPSRSATPSIGRSRSL